MENRSATKILYYICVNILGIGLITGVISFLSWPLLAEIPLAVCLYIEFIAITKYFFVNWIRNEDYSISSLIGEFGWIKKLNNVEEDIVSQDLN